MSDVLYKGLTLVELAQQALQKPEDFGWWGSDEMFDTWGWSGIDVHNASDSVQIVNFDLIKKDLMEKFPDDFEVVGLRHWAVGHVDRLTCRILKDSISHDSITDDSITDAFKAAMDWLVQLDDYPIVDDDALYEYCYNQELEWITQELPAEIYVANSKEETAALILEELSQLDDYDVVGYNLDGASVTEHLMRYAAYDLSLCDARYREFWDEWVEEEGLPIIFWGDNFGAPANVVHKLDGQLNLFDEENDA
jgi:hypothetical protein